MLRLLKFFLSVKFLNFTIGNGVTVGDCFHDFQLRWYMHFLRYILGHAKYDGFYFYFETE